MAGMGATGAIGGARRSLEGELGRRLVHMSGALVPFAYELGLPWEWLQAVLLLGVATVASLEALRLERGIESWIFEHLTRPYEQDNVAGYALYVASMAAVAVAFEPAVALPAMFALAIADPVGGVLGGDDPLPVKRPLALVGVFVVTFAIAWWYLPIAVAAGAAAAATVADGVFWRVRGYVIDDNLAIPLAVAAAAWVGLQVL